MSLVTVFQEENTVVSAKWTAEQNLPFIFPSDLFQIGPNDLVTIPQRGRQAEADSEYKHTATYND